MIRTVPMRPEDEEFLFRLYASTREQELLAWGWDETMRQEFLKMQWRAQQMSYSAHYPHADHRLIFSGEQRAGRIIIFQNGLEMILVDISLLPDFHNQGIGTKMLTALQEEAARTSLPLRLHVLKTNPAARLYERIGFIPLQDDGLRLLMEWTAPGVCTHSNEVNAHGKLYR